MPDDALCCRPVADGFALPGEAAATTWLTDRGLGRGDRVAFGLVGTPAAAALVAAAWRLGLVPVPLSARWPAGDLARLVAGAGVRGVVAGADHPLAGLPGAVAAPAELVDRPGDRLPEAVPADEAPGLVVHTSGTSGRARRVRLARRAVQASIDGAVERLALSPADTWLGVLPLDHVGGIQVVLRARRAGYALRLLPRFAPVPATDLIDGGGITGLSLVPTMLRRLLALRAGRPWPAGLRLLLTGGGPLADDLARASLAAGLAPCQTYGLSEFASMVTCPEPERAAADLGTAGRPVAGMGVRVVDGNGAPLPPGAPGRIELRGTARCDGYEDDRGAGPGGLPLTGDGWFATGDRGTLDGQGRLTVLGRADDLIVSGGENLDPLPIEAFLEGLAGVRGAAVVGEADAEWGMAAVAVLEGEPLPDGVVRAHLAGLPGHLRPKRWRWVAELPRTPLGKLRRAALRQDLGPAG